MLEIELGYDDGNSATDCMLSLTTAWVRIPAWACEKVCSDLGLVGGFRRLLLFPSFLTTG